VLTGTNFAVERRVESFYLYVLGEEACSLDADFGSRLLRDGGYGGAVSRSQQL